MPILSLKGLCGIALAGLLSAVPVVTRAGHLEQNHVTDGILVYLGVAPAGAATRDTEHESQHRTSGAVLGVGGSHHVMVAIFDAASGARITDADVEARVSPLGLVGWRKPLVPIAFDGALTYCNYFDLAASDTYTIRVEIRVPASGDVKQVSFLYAPHAD